MSSTPVGIRACRAMLGPVSRHCAVHDSPWLPGFDWCDTVEDRVRHRTTIEVVTHDDGEPRAILVDLLADLQRWIDSPQGEKWTAEGQRWVPSVTARAQERLNEAYPLDTTEPVSE